jgi:glutamyl-Q tRNA(Asp) synthetase
MTFITRFAPSPTGHLHLGHAYSALYAKQCAEDQGGRFLLRIEDIDPMRCKTEYEVGLLEDLKWLGLNWPTPVRRQSEHIDDYQNAITKLQNMGLLYPCFCSRKDIRAEIAAAGYAPHASSHGPEGPLYPGICRNLSTNEQQSRIASGVPFALRLNTNTALQITGPLTWHDQLTGTQVATPEKFGDPVLARKDIPTSYHLSVTVDDHIQGITFVTRGQDLYSSTHIHRLLQALLNLDTPTYLHHQLLTDSHGQRYAKRSNALTLKFLRDEGHSATSVREMAFTNV